MSKNNPFGDEDTSALLNADDELTADKLEFHSFTGSSGGAGGITGSGKGAQQHQQAYSAPPRMAAAGAEGSEWDGAASAPPGSLPQPATSGGNSNTAPIYTIEYYMKYFDVDSSQVLSRMLAALVPLKPAFFSSLGNNPDMYGPFWIATTLVFILFVAGNLSGSMASYANGEDFEPDFTQLSWAATAVYSYVFGAPVVLYFAFKWFSIPAKMLELFCLYGYGMTVFLPVAVLSILPWDGVKWALACVALVVSGAFLALNLWPLATTERKMGLVILGVAMLVHVGIVLLFKFVFFTYSITDVLNPTTTPTVAATLEPAVTEAPASDVPVQ